MSRARVEVALSSIDGPCARLTHSAHLERLEQLQDARQDLQPEARVADVLLEVRVHRRLQLRQLPHRLRERRALSARGQRQAYELDLWPEPVPNALVPDATGLMTGMCRRCVPRRLPYMDPPAEDYYLLLGDAVVHEDTDQDQRVRAAVVFDHVDVGVQIINLRIWYIVMPASSVCMWVQPTTNDSCQLQRCVMP